MARRSLIPFGRLTGTLAIASLVGAAAAVVLWACAAPEATIRATTPLPESAVGHQPAVTVRVASFNAWLLPFGADDVEDRRARMGPAVAALDPDVLCLQEVWTEDGLEPVAGALSAALPSVATSDGGLAVLSRWPIRDARFAAFPRSTAPSFTEWLARKGILTVDLATPVGPLRVVNTHLAFDRSAGREGHREQLGLLLDHLAGDPATPTVLCGDLNLPSRRGSDATDEYLALGRIGFVDAATASATGQPGLRAGTRVGWPRAGRRAGWDPDYVMVRSGDSALLSVTRFRQALDTQDTALSDHNLLLADLVLVEAEARAAEGRPASP